MISRSPVSLSENDWLWAGESPASSSQRKAVRLWPDSSLSHDSPVTRQANPAPVNKGPFWITRLSRDALRLELNLAGRLVGAIAATGTLTYAGRIYVDGIRRATAAYGEAGKEDASAAKRAALLLALERSALLAEETDYHAWRQYARVLQGDGPLEVPARFVEPAPKRRPDPLIDVEAALMALADEG